MDYMGETFISTKHKKEEFINLHLDSRSDERDWNFAIEIFEDRIRGRYLDIIDRIVNNGCLMVDGFSVMALNCLLIETLLQFKNGWDETKNSNRDEYSKFLKEEFPHVFTNKDLALKFYSDIRCGILHSAQTKNGSQLTVNKKYVVAVINTNRGKRISVDVVGMSRIVKNYYSDYIEKLRNVSNVALRDCFFKKMDHLCRN